MPEIPQQRAAAIAAYYRKGHSLKDTATRYHHSVTVIRRALEKLDVKIRKTGRPQVTV